MFAPAKEVPVLSHSLILSSFIFVFVNALAVDELADLLGQLRTSEISILIIPKQSDRVRKETEEILTFQK